LRINETAKKNIGTILKERRIKAGLSQQEMCDKAGISQIFLSFIENGRRVPSKEVLARIAEVLGEKPEHLEVEAGLADSNTVIKLDCLIRRIVGSGDSKKLKELVDAIEKLG